MNLINFHTHRKNEKFVRASKVYTCGQGLYHSYSIMLFGNGHNKYVITLEYRNEEYKIIVKEKYVVYWTIAGQYTEEPDIPPHSTIKFDAIGKWLHSGNYTRLSSSGCNNYDYLNDHFKIIDISIKNKYPLLKIMTHITNDNIYCDLIDERYANIEKKLRNNIDTTNMMIVNYEDLFDDKNWNITYYMILSDYNNFPCDIIRAKKSDEHKYDLLDAFVYCNGKKLLVNNIKMYYDSELKDEDGYNIHFMFRIECNEIDEIYSHDYSEYGYIMK